MGDSEFVNMQPRVLENLSNWFRGSVLGIEGYLISSAPGSTRTTSLDKGFEYSARLSARVRARRFRESKKPPATIASSREKVLAEINERIHLLTLTPVVVSIAVVVTAGIWLASLPLLKIVAVAATLVATAASLAIDRHRRSTPLSYALAEHHDVHYRTIRGLCELLSRAEQLWILQEYPVSASRKGHKLIQRQKAMMRRESPKFILSESAEWCLGTEAIRIYFFPDNLYIFQNGHYDIVPYDALDLNGSSTQFLEEEDPPDEARILGYDWKYTSPDGRPDARFKDNRQVPLVEYGLIEFKTKVGFHLVLQVSLPELAPRFIESFKKRYDTTWTETEGRRPKVSDGDRGSLSPYDVLEVSPGASFEEISSAYRRMAQIYHPDKVATLAPEIRELADKRMKEINIAYSILKANRHTE